MSRVRAVRGPRCALGTRCERGAEIARMLDLPEPTQAAIRSLDEHWDGSGHPAGPRGEGIPLLGRILCLAQSVEVVARLAREATVSSISVDEGHGPALRRPA